MLREKERNKTILKQILLPDNRVKLCRLITVISENRIACLKNKKPTTKKRVKIKIICKKDFCVDGLGHCFTSGREYKKINYSPCDGYCIKNDIGDDDWIFYPGHEFFDEYFKIVGD